MFLPLFRGQYYIDGALSNNLPMLDDDTITISPFTGEHDICPQDYAVDQNCVVFNNTFFAITSTNMHLLSRILFPVDAEVMRKLCSQGFNDTLRFLRQRNFLTTIPKPLSNSSLNDAVKAPHSLADPSPVDSDIEEYDHDKEIYTMDPEDSGDSETFIFEKTGHRFSICDCTPCRRRRSSVFRQLLPVPVSKTINAVVEQLKA